MNLDNLKATYPSLLSRLEEEGYSNAYIARIRSIARTVVDKSDIMGWDNYRDVLQHYEESGRTQDTITKNRTAIGAIMEFDLNGKFPDRTHSALARKGTYLELSDEFRKLIDNFEEAERERCKKESSIKVESSNASSFFLKAQNAGAAKLDDVTEEMAAAILMSPDDMSRMCSSQKKCVANVIRSNIPHNPQACQRVLDILPATRKRNRNVRYLNDEEGKAVLLAFDDMSNALTLRDRSIGKLAYFTGMRSSDIAALDLASIDWHRDVIALMQQKTGVGLEIPLRAPVGNAIFDYLVKERPPAESPALFLSRNRPYRRLTGTWHTAARILAAAGVRKGSGDRKGLHIFRHHVATCLMDNDVPQAVITDLLGHTAPRSLEPYLSADVAQLRKCALSISRFPVEGVFADA